MHKICQLEKNAYRLRSPLSGSPEHTITLNNAQQACVECASVSQLPFPSKGQSRVVLRSYMLMGLIGFLVIWSGMCITGVLALVSTHI